MPTIAYFYGIAIRMYYLDHPPPHFRAVTADMKRMSLLKRAKLSMGDFREPRQRWLKLGPLHINPN